MSSLKRGNYPVEQYWPLIVKNVETGRMMLDGDSVRVGSMRMRLFKAKGLKCVLCGIEGKYFRKEIHLKQITNIWHLNLYAIGSDNKKVLMTKDHIVPVCKGGKATLDNLQPMCAVCNHEVKSDMNWNRLQFLNAFMKFDINKLYGN